MAEDKLSDLSGADSGEPGEGSLFSILRPSPSPRSGGGGHSNDGLTELIHRLDRVEKNLSAQAASASPPVRPPAAESGAGRNQEEAVLSRLCGLEAKLAEITEKLISGTASARVAEESKASARREIEALLKVVREQQKYSEMDRQLHEQVEKSWRRVEELEKKLMEFYSGILKEKPDSRNEELEANLKQYIKEQFAALRPAPDFQSTDYGEFDAKLERFYGRLEEALSRGIKEISGVAAEAGRLREIDARHFEKELRKGLLSLTERGDGLHKEIQEDASRLFNVGAAASAKVETALVTAGIWEEAVKKDLSRLTLKLEDVFADLRSSQAGDSLKQECLMETLAAGIRKDVTGLIMERFDRLETALRESCTVSSAHTAAVQELADTAGRFLTVVNSVQTAALNAAAEIEKTLPQQLIGVSGMVLKRNLLLLRDFSATLEGDLAQLGELRRAMAFKAADILVKLRRNRL